jgi:hypothetical protein
MRLVYNIQETVSIWGSCYVLQLHVYLYWHSASWHSWGPVLVQTNGEKVGEVKWPIITTHVVHHWAFVKKIF